MTDEHEFEPVRGLPEALPPGERILWQGEPDVGALARTVFFSRAITLYFAVVIAWQGLGAWRDGVAVGAALAGTAALAAAAIGLAWLFARLYAGTTVYTITDRRVVIRFGLALPLNVNLPHAAIQAVQMKPTGHGCGDLVLALTDEERVGYVQMWPCVKRWEFSHPRPALRAVPAVAEVAAQLGAALEASSAAGSAPASMSRSVPTRAVAA